MPKIGVMDSGVGGLSVLRQIHELLPTCSTIYLADQAHVPYGPRPHTELDRFVDGISQWLWSQGAEVIVLACHAASAASLQMLRSRYPDKTFVGIEPAVKPAVTHTQSGIIGVLTTQATANGPLYQRVLQQFAQNTQVITQIAPELVLLVEQGRLDSSEAYQVVDEYIQPMLDSGADQIVLACTHFPFLSEAIRASVGNRATLVDPGPAVARQVKRVLPAWDEPEYTPTHEYATTGNLAEFIPVASSLMGQPIINAQQVHCGD